MLENLPDLIKEFDDTPYLAHNGIELCEYDEGRCLGRIRLEPYHLNLHKTMHGGCVFSLADAIASYTAMTLGTIVTTLNGSINYLSPVKDTKYLYCDGRVIKAGKTVTVVRTELYDDNKKLLADGSFSCFVLAER